MAGINTFDIQVDGGGSTSAGAVVTGFVYPALGTTTANGVLYLNGSKVATSGSALVFDGSNLGLGVTPTYGIIDAYKPSGTASYIVARNGGGAQMAMGVAGDNGSLIGTLTNHNLRIVTYGAVAATVDTSGNLGLGVTPSAWYATIKALQIGSLGGTVVTGNTVANGSATFGLNWYAEPSTATTKYAANGYASYYSQSSGQHLWLTAPSGTAGNAITFTQVLAVEGGKSLALEGATSQTGTGITFPATQSASSDANTLDDYEEGDWTPSIGGNATYASRYGKYTKIGNVVTCQFLINISTLGTGSAGVLSGLPFTSAGIGSVQTGSVSYYSSLAVNTIFLAFYVENNATTIQFVGKAASGTTVDNAIQLFGNGTTIYGSVTYRAA